MSDEPDNQRDGVTVTLPMDLLPCPTCGVTGRIDWRYVKCDACGAQLTVFMQIAGQTAELSPESVDNRQQQRDDAEAK
jgi:hypothetical protein